MEGHTPGIKPKLRPRPGPWGYVTRVIGEQWGALKRSAAKGERPDGASGAHKGIATVSSAEPQNEDVCSSESTQACAESACSGKRSFVSASVFRDSGFPSSKPTTSSGRASISTTTTEPGLSQGSYDGLLEEIHVSSEHLPRKSVHEGLACSRGPPASDRDSISEALGDWADAQGRAWQAMVDPMPPSSSGQFGNLNDSHISKAGEPFHLISPTQTEKIGGMASESGGERGPPQLTRATSPSEPLSVHPAWQSWLDHCKPASGSRLSVEAQPKSDPWGTPDGKLIPLPCTLHEGRGSPDGESRARSPFASPTPAEVELALGTSLPPGLALLRFGKAGSSEDLLEGFPEAEGQQSSYASSTCLGLSQDVEGACHDVHLAEPPGLSSGFARASEEAVEAELASWEAPVEDPQPPMFIGGHAGMLSKSASPPRRRGWDFGNVQSFTPPRRDLHFVQEWDCHTQGSSGELSDEVDLEKELEYGGAHILQLSGLTHYIQERHVHEWLLPFVEETKEGFVEPTLSWVDDATVLLVFPSPEIASCALSQLQSEGHDVLPYADAHTKCLDQPWAELQPPRLRPATHAGLAMRLIAHALEMPQLLKHQTVREHKVMLRAGALAKAARRREQDEELAEGWGS